MDFKIPKLDELKERFTEATAQQSGRTRSVRDTLSSIGGNSGGRSRSTQNDDYGNYDDYGQDSYGANEWGEYSFDDSADYAEPAATSAFSPSMPNLVSSDDVRAYTQYTPSDEASAPRQAPVSRDFSSMHDEPRRSPGVDSLFKPSTPAQPQAAATPEATQSFYAGSAAQTQSIPPVSQAQDSSEGRVVQRAARIITTLEPKNYDDIERLVGVLKAGDVAVLSLKNAPAELSGRLLDFAFGVACALDARVECPGGKVYAFTRGAGITDSELSRMKSQGLV